MFGAHFCRPSLVRDRKFLPFVRLTKIPSAHPMKKRRTVFVLSLLALIPVVAEVAVRFSGISDFPIYQANEKIGYIPAPSQSGEFLRRNHWQFNSKSMGAPEFSPSRAKDTLLIGDSIVLGGNPYREEDRLGPKLAAALKNPVWPISAGSWALRNELKYLKLHPEVVQEIDEFIFIINSGDFDEASSWSCERTHPRARPIWSTLYVFKKYVWDWEDCGTIPLELTVPKGSWKADLREFLTNEQVRNKPISFFLYPNKEEMEGGDKSFLEYHSAEVLIEAKASNSVVSIFSVAKDARWRPTFYRDGIHPTIEGTRILADIIASPASGSALSK